jgi:hypothetical protein
MQIGALPGKYVNEGFLSETTTKELINPSIITVLVSIILKYNARL